MFTINSNTPSPSHSPATHPQLNPTDNASNKWVVIQYDQNDLKAKQTIMIDNLSAPNNNITEQEDIFSHSLSLPQFTPTNSTTESTLPTSKHVSHQTETKTTCCDHLLSFLCCFSCCRPKLQLPPRPQLKLTDSISNKWALLQDDQIPELFKKCHNLKVNQTITIDNLLPSKISSNNTTEQKDAFSPSQLNPSNNTTEQKNTLSPMQLNPSNNATGILPTSKHSTNVSYHTEIKTSCCYYLFSFLCCSPRCHPIKFQTKHVIIFNTSNNKHIELGRGEGDTLEQAFIKACKQARGLAEERLNSNLSKRCTCCKQCQCIKTIFGEAYYHNLCINMMKPPH